MTGYVVLYEWDGELRVMPKLYSSEVEAEVAAETMMSGCSTKKFFSYKPVRIEVERR